jgi:hypothetical protein
MSTTEAIAPKWLGYYPIVIWGFASIVMPPIILFNKPLRNAFPPPLGPTLFATGDVDPLAARKGWLLSLFPFFMLATVIVGSGAAAPCPSAAT